MLVSVILLILPSLGFASDLPPPATVYHYGSWRGLQSWVQAGAIPQRVWDEYIMGQGGGYGLKPFRRGFYGTSHPAFADYYGDLSIGKGSVPWFVVARIDPRCRASEVVADVRTLPENPRFRAWIASAPESGFQGADDFTARCYEQEPWGTRRPLVDDVGGGDQPDNECERTIQRFFAEAGILSVVDMAWGHSWYFRDRRCMTRIEGTPRFLLQEMAFLPGYWRDEPFPGQSRSSYWSPRWGAATFVVFVQAMAAAASGQDGTVESALLLALRKAAEASDLTHPYPASPGPYVPWLRDAVLATVDAEVRCRQNGGTGADLARAEHEFLGNIQRPEAATVKAFGSFVDQLVQAAARACRL